MTNTDQPVPRIPATQWLQENAEAQARQEQAAMIEREREAAKMKADASHIVDVFMLQVSEGKDPWAKPPRSEVNLGEGDPTVLTMAKEELIALGYKARVDHPTDIGPGGRGQMTETWTNEKVWNLYVARPAAK